MKFAVTSCEVALDRISKAQQESEREEKAKNSPAEDKPADTETEDDAKSANESPDKIGDAPHHVFQGVFRVGSLATGLFRAGDRSADLVFVTPKWPTTDHIIEISGELEASLKVSVFYVSTVYISHWIIFLHLLN